MEKIDLIPYQQTDTFSPQTAPSRQHEERTRILLTKSVNTILHGEQITPDLYAGAFPGHTSVEAGLGAAFQELEDIHEEVQVSDNELTTTRLIELAARASMLSTRTSNIYSAVATAPLPKEIDDIVQNGVLPEPDKVSLATLAQEHPEEYAFVAQHDSDDIHPEAFYTVYNGLGKAHENVFDPTYMSPSTALMWRSCRALSNFNGFGAAMTIDLLSRLQERLTHTDEQLELYHKIISQHPYKLSLMRNAFPRLSDDLRQDAADELRAFTSPTKTAGTATVSSAIHDFDKIRFAKNYQTTMRALSVAYFSLRRVGYSQHEAVAGLYDNGGQFLALTKGVSDRNITAPRTTAHGEFTVNRDSFDDLYSRPFGVKKGEDGQPKLIIPVPPPHDIVAVPEHLSQAVHDRSERVRRTLGRCPIRQNVSIEPAQSAPVGITVTPRAHTPGIIQLQENIRNRYGVDPKLIHDGQLRLTALVMAVTTYASEHYGLFDELDHRFKTRKWL